MHSGFAVGGSDLDILVALTAEASRREEGAGLDALARHRGDGCILIGDASALGVDKCIALLANNPGDVLDYEDVGDNWKRGDGDQIFPTIAIPKTAGTGSEVGRAAVIVDPGDQGEKNIFHP